MGQDPLMAALDRKGSASGEGLDEAARRAAHYLVEFFYLAAVAAAFGGLYLATRENAIAAGIFLALILLVFWRVRFTRRIVGNHLATAKLRRRWDEAIRYCGFPHRIPITQIRRIEGGHRARIRVSRGVSFPDVNLKAERIAAHLGGVRELKVRRDPHDASTGTVTFLRSDPLARDGEAWPVGASRRGNDDGGNGRPGGRGGGPGPASSPPANGNGHRPFEPARERNGASGLWQPIPFGRDEHGDPISLTLPERSVLIGGSPGSGKSVCASILLGAAALDASVHLWLIDGKMVEFAEWEDLADGFAHSVNEGIYLLYQVQRIMEDRYRTLRERGDRKVTPGSGMPLHVLFIDELALFTANPDTRSAKEFTILLTDIVARCRAAGIIPIAATQKPEGSVVSTNLRDLFAYRYALRCGTPDASDTILGKGKASQGFNAMSIAPGQPGIGFLLAEDGEPRRIRNYHLTDPKIRAIAAEARQNRGKATKVKHERARVYSPNPLASQGGGKR